MTRIRFKAPPPIGGLVPYKLVLVNCTNAAISGSVFSIPFTVRVYTFDNQPVLQAGIQVAASVVLGSFLLSNNIVLTDASGTATFTNLTLGGTGNAQLRASSGTLTVVDSPIISVTSLVIVGWGNPPNLGVGYTQPNPTFDGTLLPTHTYGGSGNVFGMVAAAGQIKTLSIENDATNPTNSGKVMRCKFPGPEDPDWVEAFTNGGGRAPSRWHIATALAGYNFHEVHFRMRHRLTVGWSAFGPTPSAVIVHDTVPVTSSTTTSVFSTGKAWVTDQWVGYYVSTPAHADAWRIIANDATHLYIRPDVQYRFGYNGAMSDAGTVHIISGVANSNFGYNAGMKGIIWPRVRTTAAGSGTVHGQAYSLSGSAYGGENNFLWMSKREDTRVPIEQIQTPFENQIHDWNGVGTDGQGAVGTNGNVSNGVLDRFGTPVTGALGFDPGITYGDFFDMEVYLKMNTPGLNNGIFRMWLDGSSTPRYEATNCWVAPKYVIQTVNVGGVLYSVPLLVSGSIFDYMFADPTFGGGLHIPDATQYWDIQAFQFFGK